MCTIIALHRVHSGLPLVVAANRDEFFARPAEPPRRLASAPRVVGGVDPQGGGSWMGVAETGLFVGLTNQRTHQLADQSLRSRGRVVVDALCCGSVAGVRHHLQSLDARELNPFNLLYGDGDALEVAYARQQAPRIEVQPLLPGLHVLANDRLGSPEFPKAERAAQLVAPLVDRPWPELASALGEVLADHELPPEEDIPAPPAQSVLPPPILRQLQALCIHTPVYGTRSAMIIAVEPGRVRHFLYAGQAPCSCPFEDVTPLLQRKG